MQMRWRYLALFFAFLTQPLFAQVVIMPADVQASYLALMPVVAQADVESMIHASNTLWYDNNSIVAGYQDSMLDPKGFRPNTIDPELINLAVPGGWGELFSQVGRFQFPFGTGGADRSDNLVRINFWWTPTDNNQKTLPVVYWKMASSDGNFLRWRWMFPVGTSLGEVLMVKFPDGDLRVSEIRVRTRAIDGWQNQVFRPFLTAVDLANAVQSFRPNWASDGTLSNLVNFLTNNNTLTARTLETTAFTGAFDREDGYLDYLPDFGDPTLVKQLLSNTAFKSVGNVPWKTNGTQVTYAASTEQSYSIVPREYDGGMLPVNNVSCTRCHESAGRQFNDFHPELLAYGDIWGEDQIFTWHPFENSSFVDANGAVVNFDNDNRTLRSDFISSGLVQLYDPSVHPASTYQEIAHSWQYQEY